MRGMSCSTTVLDNDMLVDGLCRKGQRFGSHTQNAKVYLTVSSPPTRHHTRAVGKRGCVIQTALNNWKRTWLLLALFERPHVWFGVSSSISNESLRSTSRTEAGMFVPVVPPLKAWPHCHVLQQIACVCYRWKLKCSLFSSTLVWSWGILGIWPGNFKYLQPRHSPAFNAVSSITSLSLVSWTCAACVAQAP